MKEKNRIKNDLYQSFRINNIKIERDVFDYGYSILLNYLTYLFFLLTISNILKIEKHTILFLLFFIPLRKNIGGFHFKTRTGCLLGSVFTVMFFSLIASKLNYIKIQTNIIVFLLCFILTMYIGVVDHPNKKITLREKIIFRRRAIILELIYLIVMIGFKQYANDISNIIYLNFIFFIVNLLSTTLIPIK